MQRRNFDAQRLASLVQTDYSPERLQRIQTDPVAIHLALLEDLRDDVRERLPPHDTGFLDRCDFGLIPSGQFNAVTFGPVPCSDGYVIGFNNGLLNALALVSAAMVVETFDPPDHQFGGPYYTDSVAFRGTSDPRRFERALWALGELTEEVVVRVAANQTVMLWFVALHELGHIVHGDVDSGASAASLNASDDAIEYASADWDRELEADAYAVKSLLSNQATGERAWINFATIYLLFRWMEETEEMVKADSCHPPARTRANHLRSWVESTWGPDRQGLLPYLEERFEEWKQFHAQQES